MRPALALYSAGMWLAQPLLRRKLARRGRTEPGYLDKIEERFGRYGDAVPEPVRPSSSTFSPASALSASAVPGNAPGAGPRIWIHAVSLGETRAAAGLVAALRARFPGMQLLLTHGTATGRAEGLKLLRPGDLQAWQPWDTPGAVGRFLAHFRPAAGLLMETEVWPNLVAGCARAGVPLALANARLSAKSLASAMRLAVLSKGAFSSLAAVWAQSEADAVRLRQLGAPVQGIFGNLKFDVAPSAVQLAQGRAIRNAVGRPVVMLASAREGEEALWLAALQRFNASARVGPAPPAIENIAADGRSGSGGPIRWLVVPRHPQRFDEVARLMEAAGLRVLRRSQWTGEPASPPIANDTADAWLGDSLGEMALYYGMADVALLGGSFAPFGGQNLIEAAACGCPVVMGPSTFNFSEASALAEAEGAAFRVGDMDEGVQVAGTLALDAARHADARTAALAFAAAHRGAAMRTADAVAALLGEP